MAPFRYYAYNVSLHGITKASYELQATNDDAAKVEARYFLKFHPSIEIWYGGRCVARLADEGTTPVRGH
jgi:hypothetical protein